MGPPFQCGRPTWTPQSRRRSPHCTSCGTTVIPSEIEEFLKAVGETPQLWKAVDARVVAIQMGEGRWHSLSAHFRLTPETLGRVERVTDLPCFDRFRVLQQVYDIEELPSLVEKVATGELEIQGVKVEFRGNDSGGNAVPFDGSYSGYYLTAGGRVDEYLRDPYAYGHALVMFGAKAYELFRAFPGEERGLDAQLRGLADPWGGVSDLLLHGLREGRGIRSHDPRRAAFVAPLPARLCDEECVLLDGVLTFTIRAGARAVGEACVVIFTGIDARGKRLARRESLGTRRWYRDGEGFILAGRVKLRGATRVRITLRVGSFEIDEATVENRQPMEPLLLRAYNALFTSPRSLDGVLRPDPKQARTFEKDVALLLGYCGLVVEYFGDGKEQEGPDLLAHIPGTPIVLVVEITVGPLNQKGKMARLIERAERTRAAVSAIAGAVLPVMVTANARSAVAENELKDAQDDGVRVLTMDDISALLWMAYHRAPLRAVAKFLAPQLTPGVMPGPWALQDWHRDWKRAADRL
jgi:hypothetical protein